MDPDFVPALELNAGFYRDVVEPIIRRFTHGAALIGTGSELLGFDTERSTDHGWGPRLQVFVDADDVDVARAAVDADLPADYRGWPVVFGWDAVAPTHHVTVTTLDAWLRGQLGCNPLQGVTNFDWLTMSQQRLLGVVRGAVYHDATGQLTEAREQLRYFPPDVALWLLACQWRRIWQQEALVGRTAEVGDESGSRVVTARIVRDVMQLHFILERTYWPYGKWFGSAYRQLPGSDDMLPALAAALDAPDFPSREDALVEAYEQIARVHNASGLTEPLDPEVVPFHGRPFRVPDSDQFVQACLRRVTDPELLRLPLIGSVDQISDSTDVLQDPDRTRALGAIYDFPS